MYSVVLSGIEGPVLDALRQMVADAVWLIQPEIYVACAFVGGAVVGALWYMYLGGKV